MGSSKRRRNIVEETSCRIHGSVEKAAVAEACEKGRAETVKKLWGHEKERKAKKTHFSFKTGRFYVPFPDY